MKEELEEIHQELVKINNQLGHAFLVDIPDECTVCQKTVEEILETERVCYPHRTFGLV
jgi:hypothetical protein